MARKRSISIEFWTDPKVVILSRDERLLFLGLISNANDYGKLRGEAYVVKSKVLPNDNVPLETVQKWLNNLNTHKLILMYVVNGEAFIKLLRWEKNQTISHPSNDEYPDPPESLWKPSGEVQKEEKISKDKLSEIEVKLIEYIEQSKLFKNILQKGEFVRSLTEAFPHKVIINELKRMNAWLIANPKKQKKDYKRFIVNWLGREPRGTYTGGGDRQIGASINVDEIEKGNRAVSKSRQAQKEAMADPIPKEKLSNLIKTVTKKSLDINSKK